MKLLRVESGRYEFELRWAEQVGLHQVLELYPLVPAAHHRLSRGELPNQAENQALLEEALAGQRTDNRRRIEALLNESGRFVPAGQGCRASFSRKEIEWLLQVCNDVRLGSWIALGCPEERQDLKPGLSDEVVSHITAMDVAAYFELCFLSAVTGELPTAQD